MTGDPGTFVAVWPIVQMNEPGDLIHEARKDLPRVALKARATLTGPPRFYIRPGYEVPGSGGAEFVVFAEAAAIEAPMPAWRRP